MEQDDFRVGSFVRPVWIEKTGALDKFFNQLSFTTKGPKHRANRFVVFASIVKAALEDEDNLVYWISNREKHTNEGYPVSLKVFNGVVSALKKAGWIDVAPNQMAKDGRARRFVVSSSLTESLIYSQLKWDNLKPDRPPLTKKVLVKINARPRKRYLVQKGFVLPPRDYTENDVEAVRNELEALNSLALEHSFTGLKTSSGMSKNFRGFYRVFIHNLEWAGRLYGGCEQMRPDDRSLLRIDDEEVCEIDIAACQPTILSSRKCEAQPFEEAPEAPDYYALVVEKLNGLLSRDEVKSVITKALGNGNLPTRNWPQGLKKAGYKWSDVVTAFLEAMPSLSELEPIKEDTFTLQFTEASIIFDTIFNLYKHTDIAALPVHDSIVVSRAHMEQVKRTLSSTFWYKTGVRPRLSIK